MQTQFQLGRYIHACTNETHSLLANANPDLLKVLNATKMKDTIL